MRIYNNLALGLLSGAVLVEGNPVTPPGGYAENQLPLRKDEPHVAENFPDIEMEILSPAFLNPETVPAGFKDGTAGPTDQATLEKFLKDLADRHNWVSYHEDEDLVSEEKRSLPYVRLCADGECDSAEGKLRILLEGAVHGNEPAGDQAVLAILAKLDANETWAQSVLEKTEILALPRYNPDGVAYFQRLFASGYDPNRDHAVLQRQQSRDIKSFIGEFDPHIVLDAHEYSPTTYMGASEQWIKAQDAQITAGKNQNVHKDVMALSEGLFTNAIFAALKSHGLRTGPYFPVTSGTDDLVLTESSSAIESAKNTYGLFQAVAFLCEIRGIGLGDQHFQRRVATGLIVAETIIQSAVDNFDHVYDTIKRARKDFEDSVDEIVVVDEPRPTEITMDFIDARNGSVVPVPAQWLNNTYPDIVLTRPRPEAYIFSGAWAGVAEHLRVFGLEVEELSEEWSGTVEALTVETVELAKKRFQGIVQTTVTMSTHMREVQFPKGAYRVSTKQKNAAFAFVMLEPETLTSYVRYNVIDVEEGEEYPVFRIP